MKEGMKKFAWELGLFIFDYWGQKINEAKRSGQAPFAGKLVIKKVNSAWSINLHQAHFQSSYIAIKA
jgi:hypothetical protein